MDKEFLTGLGIDEDTVDTILSRHCSEIDSIHINNSVKQALLDNGVKSIDAAMKLFEFDGIKVNEGAIVGLEEKISAFVADNEFLFECREIPLFSAPSNGSIQKNISREEFSKMGYSQRLKLFNENPELYSQLKN